MINVPVYEYIRKHMKLTNRQISISLLVAAVVIAVLALVGWIFDIRFLTNVMVTHDAMNPTTALSFLIAGFSLGVCVRGAQNPTWLLAATISVFLLLTLNSAILFGYLNNVATNLDQVLFADKLAEARTSPNTAFSFVFIALALLVRGTTTDRYKRLGDVFALVPLLIGLFAFIGHLYDAIALTQLPGYYGMAINTAVGFILLSLAIIFSNKSFVWKLVATRQPGSVIADTLFVPIILTQVIAGYYVVHFTKESPGAINFYVALSVTFTIIITTAVLFLAAILLNRAYVSETLERLKKDSAERQNLELEQAVKELDSMTVTLDSYNKRLQNEIEFRDRFISLASHEIKTPMTSLKVYAEIIEQKTADLDPELKEMADRMLTQTNKLINLVHTMLDVSSVDQEHVQFNNELVDFDTLIADAVKDVEFTTEQHTIELTGRTGVRVRGDSDKLSQVFLNLLINAIKYSPQATKIKVLIEADVGWVRAHITDYGIGITEDDQKSIFDRFFRAREVQSRPVSGLGIGLFLARELINKHDGNINVQSTLGEGSTFTVSLPIASV